MSKSKNAVRYTALVGMMAATIECAKLALAAIPNVEAVSLLIALYSYVFGWAGVLAAVVFVCIEPLIYGIGSWMLTYFLFWPGVALLFMLFGKIKLKSRIIFTLVAIGLSIAFGMLSALIDIAFMTGVNGYYFSNVIIYYIRGLGFDTVHVVSNGIVFITLFLFLQKKLDQIKKMYAI